MKIDPRSDRIALHYTGNDAGEPAISGVPARDLTHNDVDRLVFVEHGEISGAAREAAIDKLVAGLTAGPYRVTAPTSRKSTASKTAPTADQPITPPASPAETPAEPSADSAEGEGQ